MIFSPTGGTEKVARLLTSVWAPEKVREIDLSDPQTDLGNLRLTEEDCCYISFPVFEGRVPQVVLDRLSAIRAGGTPAVFAAVYGNRAVDDALLEMKEFALSLGFVPAAAVCAVAEHSVLRQYGTGRPDPADRVRLVDYAVKIQERLCSDKIPADLSVPGKRPYCVIKSPSMVPHTGEGCTGCGVCAERCPVRAITQVPLSVTDESACISCMRCMSVCPTGARSYDRAKVNAFAQKLARLFIEPKANHLYL